jgi:DNA helicase HerA-like ATPase
LTDDPGILGIAGPNTSDDQIVFDALTDLSIGDAIVLNSTSGRAKEVIHQVSELRIVIDSSFHGANHEVTRATARQLGELSADGSINLTRDIAKPGDSISSFSNAAAASISRPTTDLLIGDLIGTNLPVWMDTSAVVQGHTAILGMTRMGKSSFALRLAKHLSATYPVVVVDQTGEYRKLGLPLTTSGNASTPGLTLKDLESSSTPHKEALTALRALESLGRAEYAAGAVRQRVLILEEAHQFVPEPSMLGFNAPGRDEAIQFGLLMMQVRKFGISVVLISQRTAVVAKSALSQCENVVAFKSVDQTGLDYLEAIGGRLAKDLIPRMRQGEAVLMGPSFSGQAALAVKLTYEPTTASGAPIANPTSTADATAAGID